MDPNLIPVVAIMMGGAVAVASIIAKARKHKWDLEAKMWQQKDDHSMSSSELKGMIQASVEEATKPLQLRLEALEAENQRFKSGMLQPSSELPEEKSLGRTGTKTL